MNIKKDDILRIENKGDKKIVILKPDAQKRFQEYVFLENLKTKRIREDDIFIVSFPRSGNTWLRFLIGGLYYKTPMDWLHLEQYVPDIYPNSNSDLEKIVSPRIIKSHQPYTALYKKVIYIVRDVRDVIVSYYYYQLKMFNNYNDDFNKFFKRFIDNDFSNPNLNCFGRWDEHVNGWINSKRQDLLFLRYEDLHKDIEMQTKRIVDFFKLQRTDKEIKQAIEWSSFSNMKRMEHLQQDGSGLFSDKRKDIDFVRSGKSKNWTEILSHKQLKTVHNKYGNTLIKFYPDSFC